MCGHCLNISMDKSTQRHSIDWNLKDLWTAKSFYTEVENKNKIDSKNKNKNRFWNCTTNSAILRIFQLTCTFNSWNTVIYSSLESSLKLHFKKLPLPFLHLNYSSPSVNGNIFYLTGIVKLSSFVPATIWIPWKGCRRCQALHYQTSIK